MMMSWCDNEPGCNCAYFYNRSHFSHVNLIIDIFFLGLVTISRWGFAKWNALWSSHCATHHCSLVEDFSVFPDENPFEAKVHLTLMSKESLCSGVWTSTQRSPSSFGSSLKHAWTKSMNKKRHHLSYSKPFIVTEQACTQSDVVILSILWLRSKILNGCISCGFGPVPGPWFSLNRLNTARNAAGDTMRGGVCW